MGIFIPQQTDAEKDAYLFQCFFDADFINNLTQNNLSIISGRKGSGKTAIGRFLQEKYKDYGLDFAVRLSLNQVEAENGKTADIMLMYLIIITVKIFLEKSIFENKPKKYWDDFLSQNGLQGVNSYKSFVENIKQSQGRIFCKLKTLFADVGAETSDSTEYKKVEISSSLDNLTEAISDGFPGDKKMMIFVDDISDFLDREADLEKGIVSIRDFLIKLNQLNIKLTEKSKSLVFISCIRDDLFDRMEGSNINKLENSTLKLIWDEKSFCSLMVKRLLPPGNDLNKALEEPVEFIRGRFPDDIFVSKLNVAGTNRYHTNFYAYMVSISFNRPRDFLKFCYALRERLSTTHPAELLNIESAEIEYSDYFVKELRDEFHFTERFLSLDSDLNSILTIISILSKKIDFGYAELKAEMEKFLKVKAGHRKVAIFIKELWRYGIIGFKEKGGSLTNFKYIKNSFPFPLDEELSQHRFSLHRGMLWALKTRQLTH